MAMIKALLLLSLFLATVTSLALAYDEAGGGGGGGRERELRRELEQCKQRCETAHQREQQAQQQCQRTCQQQFEERRRREQEEDERRERERRRRDNIDDDEFNPQDPLQELQRCQQTCAQRYQHGEEKQLCDRRCRERYERQEREGRRGRDVESQIDEFELDVNPHRRDDPQRRLQECQQSCRRQQHDQRQVQECQQRCQRQYEEERRRQRDENDEVEFEANPHRRDDPERRLQECQQSCRRQQHDQRQVQDCQRRCQQQYEEERRRQRDENDEVELEANPHRRDDPQRRLQECQQSCRRQQHDQRQVQDCQQRCQQQYEEERRRQRDENDEVEFEANPHRRDDPQRRLQECQQSCRRQRHDQRQVQECQQRCQERYEEERQRQRDENVDREREWGQQRGESRDNPYHIHSQRLQSRFRTDEGHLRVIEKLSERSELLRGLENYRVAILEAAPNTFVAPHHCDADTVFVVTRGRGTISIVRQNNKDSHNIERTDVVPVRAGSTVYLINQDNNERLQIVKLVTPVNVPGEFEEYFPAGSGENPQSYFSAFSTNILRQSLSATEEQIERLIGEQRQGQKQGQRQGFIKRASQEQLRSLSEHATSPRRRGRESSGPINLQNQPPLYSNNHGKFYQVNPEDNKELKNMDVLVNWCELKQGSIMVPHYNSKATILAMVVEGTGRMEMACPHLARQSQQRGRQQEEESQSGQFERVTAQLSPGDVFIIPAGHPVAVVASSNQNLRMVGFGVNARNNERNFIAGKDNIIKQFEREAKELAFNMPGREVEQIFNQQPKLSYFVPQEGQRQEEGRSRSHPLASILAGFA